MINNIITSVVGGGIIYLLYLAVAYLLVAIGLSGFNLILGALFLLAFALFLAKTWGIFPN